MLTLIGSKAITAYFGDEFRDTSFSDWDYQSDEGDYAVPPYLKDADVYVDSRLAQWKWGAIATPDEMLTMKVSHGYWDVHGTWYKHAKDIIFLKNHLADFIPELHDILKPIWADNQKKKNTLSLDKTKAEFFDDNVTRKYVHDSVHRSVAYNDRPWFEQLLKPGSEVLCDTQKFLSLPLPSRIEAIREEIYVLALERIVIPKDYKASPMYAYRWALKQVATNLFKGAWALEVLLNLDKLINPDVDFIARHRENSGLLELTEER